ncbi:Protein Brevis radix-like 1 [Acorus gramineus]|uniref:Protein Brevis radix-like 1 n=1 Tax=Acorus gramineus TaxID=55184 RepID=A0AAV9BA25_ACOGR|nr:Protein Brevis radix-like 1 [Acorus gramineus]
MLTCMACSKQMDDASENNSRGTSSSAKESVKSLTSQMKGMALKLSGAYKQPKEWMAQMEPGVHITFVSLPSGGNDLKRIRFREMFNKWQAQRWWGENYDRIMELYNVQRFNRQGLTTPPRSSQDSSKDDEEVASTSNASDLFETEWVEQDEPGVYITIRALTDGTRELRRVRFSRERFGEVNAKMWWEENKERIQAQYL